MYKYTLHHKLRQLTINDYEIAMEFLPKKLFVSKSTFKRWIYLKNDSPAEISYSNLRSLATFFQCEPKDLLTDQEPPKNLKELFTKTKETCTQTES